MEGRIISSEELLRARAERFADFTPVFNAYKDNDSGHIQIVMEFVEGDVLHDVWDEFSHEQKVDIIQQLRGFFSQLRHIKGSFIGSVDDTACEDQLFTDERDAYGPYEDERAFNQGIATALQQSQHGAWVNMVSDMVLKSLYGHEVVMTHGDFCPRNFIVQGIKVVAILDWEYVKALYRPAWESGWINDGAVGKILQPYFPELAVLLHTREIIW